MCNQVKRRKKDADRDRWCEEVSEKHIDRGTGILHVHNFIEWILPVVLCNGMVYVRLAAF